MNTKLHTPGPWKHDAQFDTVSSHHPDHKFSLICKLATGEDRAEENANADLICAAPDLLAALQDCLAQLEGPIEVYGDGCGNDGKKTGLSGDEFNKLKAKRLALAREAISKAKGE